MKKLLARAANAISLILSSGTVLPVVYATGSTNSLQQPDMEPVDLNSPQAIAAVKIVSCINNSYTAEQMDGTKRLIELFEKKYPDVLPLRRWWNSRNIDLAYYPVNA